MAKIFIIFCILLHSVILSVNCQSERCYFCNTEIHGETCNDPIDPTSLQSVRCADSEMETVRSETLFSKAWNFFKGGNVLTESGSTRNSTYPNVCIQMTYVFSTRNVSARGCESAQKSTTLGVMSVCEYYTRLLPTRISNFNCSTCTGNLCNYAAAQQEEVEEEESPVGPNGSGIVSLSFCIVVAVALARLIIL